MPIYEYECLDCKYKFELFFHTTGEKKDISCNRCNSGNTKRIFSMFGFKSKNEKIGEHKPGCSTCASSNCTSCH